VLIYDKTYILIEGYQNQTVFVWFVLFGAHVNINCSYENQQLAVNMLIFQNNFIKIITETVNAAEWHGYSKTFVGVKNLKFCQKDLNFSKVYDFTIFLMKQE